MADPTMPPPSVDDIRDNLDRRGGQWTRLIATIVLGNDPNNISLIVDGDTVTQRAISLLGPLHTGDRVYCDVIPPQGLYVAGFLGTPSYQSYTVSWTATGTQPTLGNSVLSGYYRKWGQGVAFRIKATFGAGVGFGTGAWLFSLPVATSTSVQPSSAILVDTGSAVYAAGAYVSGSQQLVLVYNALQVGSLVPFTWAAGDELNVEGWYTIF